jgi:hypothetical protein
MAGEDDLDRLGSFVVGQMAALDRLVARRFETVEVLDATAARRTVEIHLRLPHDRAAWPTLQGEHLVALARLRRYDEDGFTSHTTIDVRDERGAVVPRITRREERDLVLRGVLRYAEAVLGRAADPMTAAAARMVVVGNAPPTIVAASPDGEDLFEDPDFELLVREVSRHYLLLAPVPTTSPARRVFEFEYEEMPDVQPLVHGLGSRILKARPGIAATFETNGAGDCESFHVEVLAPPDLVIPPGSSRLRLESISQGRRTTFVHFDDDRTDRRAHALATGVRALSKGAFHVRFLVQETGQVLALRAATLVAGGLVLMAALAVWFVPPHRLDEIDRSAVTTLLLLTPAVVTTALAVRSRHGLASRMSYGMRITAVAPTLALFGGALALTAKPIHLALARLVWSLGLGLVLVASYRTVNGWYWLKQVASEAE